MAISRIGTDGIDQTSSQQIGGISVGKGGGNVATNTAVGASALAANTTGSTNTAVGNQAMALTTTGTASVAVGLNAAYSNTTGSSNTALGQSALFSNTTASNNTAVGYQAGYSNTTGTYSTLIGTQAGYSQTTGYGTYIGYQAGYSETTGQFNTFIGLQSGYAMTTGSKNTIIGGYTGNQGGLNITTASNYIVLSDGDGNARAYWDNNGMGISKGGGNGSYAYQVINTGNSSPYGMYIQYTGAAPNNSVNEFMACVDLSAARFILRSNGGLSNYSANNTNLSDRREKTNFAPAGDYLAKICAIPVQTFNYIDQNLEEDDGLTLGVVAQDVQAVAPELVTETNWGTKDEPKMRLSIYQTDLQYALMKALQELKAEFDAYKEAHP